jgi:hypothetical protein
MREAVGTAVFTGMPGRVFLRAVSYTGVRRRAESLRKTSPL